MMCPTEKEVEEMVLRTAEELGDPREETRRRIERKVRKAIESMYGQPLTQQSLSVIQSMIAQTLERMYVESEIPKVYDFHVRNEGNNVQVEIPELLQRVKDKVDL